MRFSVFALSSVPDTDTTRQVFGLHDLDDKAVSKVLFHRRKQQTGSSEELRWDQRAIASVTLIQHSVDKVLIESIGLAGHTERDMLQALFTAAMRDGRMVAWDSSRSGVPLIHFRSLKHALSFPAYWQTLKERDDLHVDLLDWLAGPGVDRPGLDETARKLGFPGMCARTEDDVYAAWLAGRHAEVQAFSEIAALNTYLLALRVFSVTGQVTRHDSARVQNNLRQALARRSDGHLADFLAAWRTE